VSSFALCAASLKQSAAAVAGVQPLTSPPLTMPAFQASCLEGNSLLFFKLHGAPGASFWYGDGGQITCSAEQIRSARLDGALVFAANCWGGKDSPMVQALIAAGAACVVTGEGINYAGINRVDGADVIGIVWRALLELGTPAGFALTLAKTVALGHRPGLFADIQSFSLVGNPNATLKEVPHASKASA
jgi:hypothetical protein